MKENLSSLGIDIGHVFVFLQKRVLYFIGIYQNTLVEIVTSLLSPQKPISQTRH
jgi:hypothetical protein